MLDRLRVRVTYANVMATVAVVLALGGGAYVALGKIPDSNGVIHACYKKKKGSLRVVNRPKCKKKERKLAWNQTGPQGKQGRRGFPGPSTSVHATNTVHSGSESHLTGTAAPVIDLFTVNDGSNDLRIHTTFSANIVATAHVTLLNDQNVAAAAECSLEVSDSTGPGSEGDNITPGSESTFPAVNTYSIVVTLTGAAFKPPGTYNVRMVCLENFGEVVASSASLTAVAAKAQPQ